MQIGFYPCGGFISSHIKIGQFAVIVYAGKIKRPGVPFNGSIDSGILARINAGRIRQKMIIAVDPDIV